MRIKTQTIVVRLACALMLLSFLSAELGLAAAKGTFRPRANLSDGAFPESKLVADAKGNFYGTTSAGGLGGYQGPGTVFRLQRRPNGKWQESVLYAFAGYPDAASPAAGLAIDAAGHLYGATTYGGSECANRGCGTVFELSLGRAGKWKERLLHSFGGNSDGSYPNGPLIFDASGSLYGTTQEGGTFGHGTVFQLVRASRGQWTEKILYNFSGGADGSIPRSSLTLDQSGNLYGTTYYGGDFNDCDGYSCGTVFELENNGGGVWTEKVLHTFTGYDGESPQAEMTFDAFGNLYGTTTGGPGFACSPGCGTVFQLVPNSDGSWTHNMLYNFEGGTNGRVPLAGLVFDRSGIAYGTTAFGGNTSDCNTYPGCGTVFQLAKGSTGHWKQRVLYRFTNSEIGGLPMATLFLDPMGNLYGTAFSGGTSACPSGCGTVFELSHKLPKRWTPRLVYGFGSRRLGAN